MTAPGSIPSGQRGLLVACLFLAGVHAAGAVRAEAPALDVPILFTQLPRQPELEKQPGRCGGMLRCDYGAGGRIVRLEPDGRLRVLTEGFDSACAADVSFDGQRVVFAAKRHADDPWNIWEMNADGSGVRQVTRDAGNCRTPAYQATLYTLVSPEPWYQIMFVSDAAAMCNEYGGGPATSLYSCKLDGSQLRRLTFNLSDDLDPFLMDDGRVLLASWQRMDLDRGMRGRVALFGVNTDGADYAIYCGDQGQRLKHMPCATADGLVVFVEAEQVGWDGAGQLACVTTRRNLYSHRTITHDAQWLYHSPAPLRDGQVLVSRRPADGSATHGLCRLDPRTGQTEPIFDDPERHDIHGRMLAPRPQPDGRSTVVNEQESTGKLYCLNTYLTEASHQQHMRPGLIRRLRVLEGVPLRAADTSVYLPEAPSGSIGGPGSTRNGIPALVQRRILGDFALEEDGSFHIELPANLPVQLQTLDENGMALRTCGWIWVKPHEPRGCIGCHEDPELTPENRLVLAIQKPAINLTLPPERRRTVDFRRDIQPIIDQKCARCHDGRGGGLDLRSTGLAAFSRAYVSLLAAAAKSAGPNQPVVGALVHPGQARTSPLIWRLFGRNTSRPWDARGPQAPTPGACPPAGAEPLTEGEKTAFVEWIDLGALWDGVPGEQDRP